jgi:hypothetical protein
MHYYSQFNKRQKRGRWAFGSFLVFQPVFGPEGGALGLRLLPVGETQG